MAFCQNCGKELMDGAKFCDSCGTPAGNTGSENQRKQVFDGELKKCPSCGAILSSDDLKCPQCGIELRNIKASSSVTNFNSVLFNTPKSDRADFITSFPIPNAKEDFFEFLYIAVGSVTQPCSAPLGSIDDQIRTAWINKYKQLKTRAPFIFAKDPESLAQVNQIFKTTKIRIPSWQKFLIFFFGGFAALIVLLVVLTNLGILNW